MITKFYFMFSKKIADKFSKSLKEFKTTSEYLL